MSIINRNEELHNIFQPIFSVDKNMNAQVNTYEMLIRNAEDRFPGMDFLNSLSTDAGNNRWLKASRKSLNDFLAQHPDRRVYINIEPCQMNLAPTWDFLEETYHTYGDQVAIEITERRKDVHDIDYLDNEIKRLKDIGYNIAIDDVCAGSNSYSFIVRQLDEIKRIKLSLLLFRHEDQQTRRSFVEAWLKFAAAHHLDFVIEGISDQEIAKEFAGRPGILQQGFYWAKEV